MREIELQKEATTPVRIFYVQGKKSIGELEREINKWQISLGPKASVTHISSAMTEHEDEGEDNYRDQSTRLSIRAVGDVDPYLHSGRIVGRADRPSAIVAPNRNITEKKSAPAPSASPGRS